MPLPSSLINMWSMLHKPSTPWNQTGWHNPPLLFPSSKCQTETAPASHTYRAISPVRTQNEDTAGEVGPRQ